MLGAQGYSLVLRTIRPRADYAVQFSRTHGNIEQIQGLARNFDVSTLKNRTVAQ